MEIIRTWLKWYKLNKRQKQLMKADRFLARMDIKAGFILFLSNDDRLCYTNHPGLKNWEQFEWLVEKQFDVINRQTQGRSTYGMKESMKVEQQWK